MLLHVICRVESGASGDALRLMPLVVRSGKESLEFGPHFLLWSEMFPNFAIINKETGLINELEGDAYDLFETLWSVADGSIVAAISTRSKRDSTGWLTS